MEPGFLVTQHDNVVVAASYLLAVFASFVTLDLARRVHTTTGPMRIGWWAGGALTMGTGVWAMHFVAMLGYQPGIALGFDPAFTALSWMAAVLAGGVALAGATRERLAAWQVVTASAAMAAAICGMHYVGMAALEFQPGIVWIRGRVIGSVAVAWGASAVALGLFFYMRRLRGTRRLALQFGAAAVMGLAISGMHFLGMSAAQLPLGTVCGALDGLGGRGLLVLVGGATFVLLSTALLLSVADARRQLRERGLQRSLQVANAELQQANAELQRLAFRDPLTGLSNRTHLEDRLGHACELLRRELGPEPHGPARLAVLFVDLDGFKPVNDTFGHAAGDQLLREVAERLRLTARESDTIARVGGDEFVLLLESDDALAAALASAERLITVMQRPFQVAGQSLTLSGSVGIAIHPDHGSAGTLVACADAAMYAAKSRGGACWAVYDSQMTDGASEQVALQQALRGALERQELSLHYQPKINAGDGGVHGMEALLRWKHPERGMVSPAIFIPVAERFGLIGALGRWVLDEACAQLGRWNAEGLHCRVAVNLSPAQLRQGDLVDQVAMALERHGIAPSQLVLELTETAMMDDIDHQAQMLERLAGLGVRLSIDDFGTGYSSLAYLKQLPVRQLKIDRSMVTGIEASENARAVVDAIVRLAHALQLEVVAEGVETEAQAAALRRIGCDVLQGWLFARAMPADQLLTWLERHGELRHSAAQAEAGLNI